MYLINVHQMFHLLSWCDISFELSSFFIFCLFPSCNSSISCHHFSVFPSQAFLLRTWLCRLFFSLPPSASAHGSHQMDFEVFPLICSWHWVCLPLRVRVEGTVLLNIKNGKIICLNVSLWPGRYFTSQRMRLTPAPRIQKNIFSSISFPMQPPGFFFFGWTFQVTVYTFMSYINYSFFVLLYPPVYNRISYWLTD